MSKEWLNDLKFLKSLFSGHLIFVEVGDFFEAYSEDAEIVAKELNLLLLSKEKDGEQISMVAMPEHAVYGYATELKNKGFYIYFQHKRSS